MVSSEHGLEWAYDSLLATKGLSEPIDAVEYSGLDLSHIAKLGCPIDIEDMR